MCLETWRRDINGRSKGRQLGLSVKAHNSSHRFPIHDQTKVKEDMNETKLTLGEIKRAHRQAKRQNVKARKRLETIERLRKETEDLRNGTRQIEADIGIVSDVMWSPPRKYD